MQEDRLPARSSAAQARAEQPAPAAGVRDAAPGLPADLRRSAARSPGDALGRSLAWVVRGRAAPARVARQLMTTRQFSGHKLAGATFADVALKDRQYGALYRALADYHHTRTPGSADSAVQALLSLAALCRKWLMAHPAHAWVAAGHRGAQDAGGGLGSDVVADQRLVVARLDAEVQQELVDVVSPVTEDGVFRVHKVLEGAAQTPSAAERALDEQQTHWEGWKLHVAVPAQRAGDVAAHVVPALERDKCWYKIRTRIAEYRGAHDASIGKFIVIYPRTIEHLEELATWLTELLPQVTAGLRAPQLPGDVKLDRAGYVWARYGVFFDRRPKSPVELPTGEEITSQFAIWNRTRGEWMNDPRDAAVPPDLERELRDQLDAIAVARTPEPVRG